MQTREQRVQGRVLCCAAAMLRLAYLSRSVPVPLPPLKPSAQLIRGEVMLEHLNAMCFSRL